MLTFLNKGFISTEYRGYTTEITLIEYENIYKLSKEDVKNDVFYITVIHMQQQGGASSFKLRYTSMSETDEIYNSILSRWMEYLNRNTTGTLEQKLDTLLSQIDIIPGGKDYELAKQNFES